MSLFGKRGDLLDYTYLQKRGLIKKSPEQKNSGITKTKDGFVDLSKSVSTFNSKEEGIMEDKKDTPQDIFSLNSQSPQTQNNSEQSSGFVSLFDSPTFSNNGNQIDQKKEISDSDFNAVKIKIEDLEYKLSNLIDKITLVESKLNNLEKKIFD